MTAARPRPDPDAGSPATPAPALLTLEGAGFRHAADGPEVLQGLDLRVQQGEFLSLIGPSGCGKSTLLRLLAGLAPVSSGRLLREGRPLQGPAPGTGFVFQEPTLMPWADVAANVALPLRLQGEPAAARRAKAREALAAVGLTQAAALRPHALSGGMKMRAAIARALVTRPTLLLLDEPFAALDEIGRFALNQMLHELWLGAAPHGEGPAAFTSVFVTHSLYEAAFLSQRVLVMGARPGRIVAEVRIDGPRRRDAAFRQSPRFQAACGQLAQALAEAAQEVDGVR